MENLGVGCRLYMDFLKLMVGFSFLGMLVYAPSLYAPR
jgi:hypothetical protein